MISLGGWCEKERVVEPTQWSRRFLAKLAGLEVSPSIPTPLLAYLTTPPGAFLSYPKHSSPSWMYFPGQLSVIQLRFCRLLYFPSTKIAKFPQLFHYNSAINSVCSILSLALHSAMIGTEAKAIKRFFWTQILFFVPHCAACGTSLTRGQTLAPCSGSAGVLSTGSRGKSQNTDSLL